MRVPGHGLKHEGKAFAWNGKRWELVRESWVGKALCECGWTSKKLPSDSQRKKAHREHKEQVVLQQEETGWPPERVLKAITAIYPFWTVESRVDGQGKTLVTMPFDDLCSFIEWLCGSISEFNEVELTGFGKERLASYQKTVDHYNEVMSRRWGATSETQ